VFLLFIDSASCVTINN